MKLFFQLSQVLTAINEVVTKNQMLDVDCREELEKLSIQLSQQPIEFTANDFYTINYNLLAGVSLINTHFVSQFIVIISDFNWNRFISNNSCAIRREIIRCQQTFFLLLKTVQTKFA